MASKTEPSQATDTYKLQLRTAYGPVYRDVLNTKPRDCDPSEVPIIDLSPIYGDLPARQALAATIRDAAENTGFFYIKNHGIPQPTIAAALAQATAFFAQPLARKGSVATAYSAHHNGWTAIHGSFISPTETRDYREGFMWSYDPRYDPEHHKPETKPKTKTKTKAGAAAVAAATNIPADVAASLRGEEFVWRGTAHLPRFKDEVLAYWRECLQLARRLMRIFALALDLPETYFDALVTYPGADGVFNYYPAAARDDDDDDDDDDDVTVDVGLGAHTDLQSFTLLWQDVVGGLQVLTKEGQWLRVPPVEGTFVVNIGDFLMRLTNDRFQSTVHRVFNRAGVDRYSMPFFFGFNFNEKCSVLPSCTSEGNPAKYEPITCGEWCRLRFEQGGKKTKAIA